MGSEVDLLPKNQGVCHLGHSDFVYTLTLVHSSLLHIITGKQHNPKDHLTTCVHPEVWTKGRVKIKKETCCQDSNVTHIIVLIYAILAVAPLFRTW